jgi:DNA modification methylase
MSGEAQPYLSSEFQARALAEFLDKHAKPYDPTTDDYERPPFAEDIKEGKNDTVYNAHPYHTKVPPRSIIPYILHYTQPGDVVVDPFCGSGMTGVAAQMCANPPADLLAQFPDLKDRVGPRVCILNDLSPAACHIAYNYNTPVDVDALRREFERIKAAIKDEFAWLYGTEHYEPAVGLYSPKSSDVIARLNNPPAGGATDRLLDSVERTWRLLPRAEVESRLGYLVTQLPRDSAWGELDVTQVDDWVCIPATIQYTIWSDVYRCEGFVTVEEPTGKMSTRGKNAGKPMVRRKRVARGCGESIVLWDAARDASSGAVSEIFLCPTCNLEWKKTQIRRENSVPVRTAVEHEALVERNGKLQLCLQLSTHQVTRSEKKLIEETRTTHVKDWIPSTRFDKAGPQYRRNALSARHIDFVNDLFLPRNLHALARLWSTISAVKDGRIRGACAFAFTAVVARSSRLNRLRPSGAGDPQSGTIYLSSIIREENVLRLFTGRINAQCEAFQKLRNAEAVIINGSACHLPEIPNASVDYVFTDPPFGSNIYYSEPNLLWESWLGKVTNQTEEAVVHRKNDGGTKRLPDYARLMQMAFSEVFRILKPGRWATVEFNNSDGAVFEAIKEGIREAGFQIVNMLLLDKEQKTFKQVKGAEGVEDVVDKDVLFNLHKPAVGFAESQQIDHDLDQQVSNAVRQHLLTLPERIAAEPGKYSDEHRTTATINSMLMNSLIPRGVNVEQLNLPFIERVCSRYFRKIGQRWYLRGEAIGRNGHGGLFEEEVAIKDDVSAIHWLRQKVHARPMLIGELKPLWMRAIGLLPAEVSQSLSLDELLAENFWRDEDTNRWREPTDEERERMNDDRSIRVLHDAERFLAGSLRRQTTDAERCEWIDVLFKACRQVEEGDVQSTPTLRNFEIGDGYRLITRLFQSVLRDHVAPDAYSKASKQASVASNRVAEGVRHDEEELAAQRKKKERTLFD